MKENIVTPSILPGFLELLPKDQMIFNSMLEKIKNTYESFGFIPLDTPVIEKSEILLAKSGGETEKQIYRFAKGENDLSLRFDLTVPLARYVAQHANELVFPFKRYHIGKVYRGERPQKGRFREFYQCDIDIIGNDSLSIINEAEILAVIYQTFTVLNLGAFTIRINNRKILNGYFGALGIDKKSDVLRCVDKLEKVGQEIVKKELEAVGVDEINADRIIEFVSIKGKTDDKINSLKELLDQLKITSAFTEQVKMFEDGIDELSKVASFVRSFGVPDNNFTVDLTIARGLDYYTGTIYETMLNDYPSIGSVCSGGRYENLASSYTSKKLPGVGISIGLSRLFYQLREAGLVGDSKKSTPTMLLIIPMGDTISNALELATFTRNKGISTEVYLNDGKMGKKFGYADKLGIPYALAIGEDEVKSEIYKLKSMETGEQKELTKEGIVYSINKLER